MINCKDFYNLLASKNIDFFCGVPDSLLKDFCSYILDNCDNNHHIITANEGNAIALAAGHYLSTKNFGMVYMQNSGLGNAINPLLSLVDPAVYSIPMLLMIGWRGEPGVKDEPQHITQGELTIPIIESLRLKYQILPKSIDEAKKCIDIACDVMRNDNAPYVLIAQNGTFEPYVSKNIKENDYKLSREDAIKAIIDNIGDKDIIVSTTGKASRELFEYRNILGHGHEKDFLTVGSMGHSSQIALGIALRKSERNVFCLDGDGAVIMHMGSLAIVGSKKPKNFKHIIINNGSHESVGGHPTCGFDIDFGAIAKACGYGIILKAESGQEIKDCLKIIKNNNKLSMLEIRTNKISRKDLGRPDVSPIENKKHFMKFLEE